jgi:hypothetical protein
VQNKSRTTATGRSNSGVSAFAVPNAFSAPRQYGSSGDKFVMKSSLTTLTLFPITTNDAKGWEQLGETTTRTIFNQHIGGATEKKDQREWSD